MKNYYYAIRAKETIHFWGTVKEAEEFAQKLKKEQKLQKVTFRNIYNGKKTYEV